MILVKLIKAIIDFKTTKIVLSLLHRGILVDTGWLNSFRKGRSLDNNNNPVPWVTYSFISFVNSRLNKQLEMFEYGSGNSTLYFAEKVKSILAVENDNNWYNEIKNQCPINAEVHYVEYKYGEDYGSYITKTDKKYDVVIVDGRDRVNCVKNTINNLTEKGVIVLDDSEREYYSEALLFMKEKGFKSIDFWGIAPGQLNYKSTTVFYRENNCLNI